MTRREILILMLATVSGFFGGRTAPDRSVKAADTAPVRATRFELVDASGKEVAFLGSDSQSNTVLAFEDENHHLVARFGLRGNGPVASPFLDFAGKDGKPRLNMELGSMDRPIFALSDEKWEGRVLLGFIEGDYPDPTGADWALQFRYPDFASIGVLRNPIDGSMSGVLALSNKKKLLLRVPPVPDHGKN
jgi:hypothetical protein